jgi:hypothetical protein
MRKWWQTLEFCNELEKAVSGFLKSKYGQGSVGIVKCSDAHTAKVVSVFSDFENDSDVWHVDYVLNIEYVEGDIRIHIYECEYPEFGVRGVYLGTIEL